MMMHPAQIRRWWGVVTMALAAALLAAALVVAKTQTDIDMTRVTVASDSSRDSQVAGISANGELVVFHSDSDLLGQSLPDNQFEIWLYDTATLTHTRVTTATAADRDSFSPRISADGSTLLFYSDADFLLEGIVDNQNEVWLYDIASRQFTRVTTASDSDRDSWSGSLSAGGTVAAFVSDADLLGQGIADEQIEVWLYDTTTLTYTRVTTATDPDRGSYSPHLSGDGSLLAFSSDADLLGEGIVDEQSEIWLYDVPGGALTRITYAPDSSRSSYAPSLSADGAWLTFISDVDILNQGLTAGQYEVWLYHIDTGVFTRVTTATDSGRYSDFPILNADGTKLVFHSDSDFLSDGDIADGHYEVWSYDVATAELTRVTTGSAPFRRSLQPRITALGDKVVFESTSDFLGQGIAADQVEIWLFELPGFGPTLTKMVSQPLPWPMLDVTYTLRLTNPLDLGISNAVVSDTLPSGLIFVGPVTLDPPQAGAVLAQDARDLPVLASGLKIPARSAVTLTFVASIGWDVPWNTFITNTASLTSPQMLTPTFGSVVAEMRYRVLAAVPEPNSHTAPADDELIFLTGDILHADVKTETPFVVHGGFRGHLDGIVHTSGHQETTGLLFTPAAQFLPGERIQTTLTTDVRNVDGLSIQPYVWTFRAATLGGTSMFTAHPITPTLPTYQSIGVGLGDLDGDGDLDVVLANASDAPETVWLNDGAGGLAPHPTHPAFGLGTSWDVALGDLDMDGDLDAVIANVITDTVWLNDGTGGFIPHPTIPELGTTISRHVTLGDLDGDGDLDAIFAHFHQPDTVWLNDGTGGFAPHPTAPAFGTNSSFDVALGDLDNDGDLDALVTKLYLPDVVWLNDGTGSFTYRSTLGSGSSYGLDLGDVDGDGDADAVIARDSDQPETVWINDGTGLFKPHATTPGFGAGDSLDIALGDLDGDGDLDAVVANNSEQAQTVWINDGTGNFTAQPDVPDFGGGYSSSVALGDLDGDGDLDAIVGDNSSIDVSIWINRNTYRVMLPLVLRD